MPIALKALLALLILLLGGPAAQAAGCSRPIQAPMAATGRLVMVDAATEQVDGVGRMLRGGRVEFALLSPPQAYATAGTDLSYRRVDDLPLMEVGLYLSKRMLAPADLTLLREALLRAARDGTVRRAFLKYYPAALADLNQP